MGECIKKKDFEKAAKLFAISGVYGKFDMYRVKDRSAHQALLVLQQNVLMNQNEKTKNKFSEALDKTLKKGSKQLYEVCQAIRDIGAPTYHPKYMIQHGIQAFLDKEGNGLKEDFDAEESWNLALNNYLHCNE